MAHPVPVVLRVVAIFLTALPEEVHSKMGPAGRAGLEVPGVRVFPLHREVRVQVEVVVELTEGSARP